MSDIATNVIATIIFATNVVNSFHPSGDSKVQTTTVERTVVVPGVITNVANVSTNVKFFIMTPVPEKPQRRPLELRDGAPPLPPGAKPPEVKWYPILGVPNNALALQWDYDPPDPRVEFVVESSADLLTWRERARIMETQWGIPAVETGEYFRVGSTWRK